MANGRNTRLRRPPNRPVNPLDPEAIVEDAEKLPILERNVSNLKRGLAEGDISPEDGREIVTNIQDVVAGEPPSRGPAPVATLETATEPVAEFDSRTSVERARQQNAFRQTFNQPEPPARQRLASLNKPPANGRTAPTVEGPAQRAVAAAIDRTGADLRRPDAAPPVGSLVPIQPFPGRSLTESRALFRQAGARQRAAVEDLRKKLIPPRQPVRPLVDRSIRSIQPDTDPSTAAGNAIRVATGDGGSLFASAPAMLEQAALLEQVDDVPDGEGFEPIRNFFRGLAAGGIGLGESTGTILRYLGGELGLESVAALGENIEDSFSHACASS